MRASPHADGTFHQSQLVGRDVRRGFFSPPDAALAEAVNHDADTVEFTEAEEASSILTLPDLSPPSSVPLTWVVVAMMQKAVRHKIDMRVLTLVVTRSAYVRHWARFIIECLPSVSLGTVISVRCFSTQ